MTGLRPRWLARLAAIEWPIGSPAGLPWFIERQRMTLVWTVAGVSALVATVCVLLLWNDLRAAPRSWQLLAASGLPLSLGGLGFIVRFWQPLPGPYVANQSYPLGPYLNAWAVSFGFMWLAFGLVFFALALRTPRTGRLWLALLAGWVFTWLPHGIIGVGFAWAGSNRPSVDFYLTWASVWHGLVVLATSSFILVAHFGLALAGFARTGLDLRRGRPRR